MKKRDKYEILVVLWFITASVCPDNLARMGAVVTAVMYALRAILTEEDV